MFVYVCKRFSLFQRISVIKTKIPFFRGLENSEEVSLTKREFFEEVSGAFSLTARYVFLAVGIAQRRKFRKKI